MLTECINNTSKHTDGNRLYFNITEKKHRIFAEFYDNGNPKEDNIRMQIREKGGLKNIRNAVEKAGGTMQVLNSPRFILKIELPEGEK